MNLSRARRLVLFGLGLLLAGAAVIGWTLWRHASADLPIPAELTVFAALVVGGSGPLVAWVGWRTLRLGSASQAIARWVVSEAEWQRYVAACQMRVTMPGALPGAVPLDMPVSPTGVEVLALRRGFRVGESFHEIGTLGAEMLDVRIVDSPAAMFEFDMVYSIGKTSSVQLGVRIPIAADAGALAILGFVAFLGVIALFVVINPPGWAAIGPIGTLTLTFYGFFRALRARMVRWRKEGQG